MIKRFDIFTKNISIIYKGIQQLKKEYMKNFGLNGNHMMCLFYLTQYAEGLTASQLCSLACTDKAAISRTMSDLLTKGYIIYPNFKGEKKYNTAAILTEKGLSAAEHLNNTICTMVEKMSEGVTDNDRTCMYRSLRTIATNLQNSNLDDLL